LHPPHGLLEQCKTAQAVAKLAKEMRMFGVSLGGFKCETAVPVEARSALIKEIRGSASGPVGSAHLPPAAIYAMVAEGEHPNEVPLKTLMNGTGVSVADLRIPAPERAFDFEPVSADDRASLAQSTLDAGTGDVWRKHVLDRISEQHAERDIFVAWAARRLSLHITENPEQTVDDAFGAVLTDGANRGSCVLGPLSAQYVPQSEAARELADARFCTANGPLLLSVELIKSSVSASASERAIQLKFGGARYAVELFGGKLEAMDAGHVVLNEHGA
jgi:hypothetical protein